MASLGREAWTRLIAEFEKSGQGRREFAEERGVALGTLQLWIYKLRTEAVRSPRLVPVRVVAFTAPKAREPGGWIEAALPTGIHLRIPVDIEPERLAALLTALL